jgi:23S rRNA U2552 (ribose-2'-O)-methylase RlmE/FtsJ
MNYYQLPRIHNDVYKYIECIEGTELPQPVISNALSGYLYEIKDNINNREHEWNIYKKYTNPYEYIHSIIPQKKRSVSKIKPLSRSYFKMLEIINKFHFNFDSLKSMTSFHLAEGPGGFIEALSSYRNNQQDIYIGMTILNDNKNDTNIPGWKNSESFLRKNKNVFIETGIDKTGDILSIENFLYCKDKFGSSIDFITADGGFDFSLDFNNQETTITKLLFAQICFAISMQKHGGSFVLKVFDIFMQHSIDLITILSSFYGNVYVIKPQTSRIANSERYIVCKDFIFTTNEEFYPYLYNAFNQMTKKDDTTNRWIHRFLSVPIPYYYSSKLEEINAILGQQQIENIYQTIYLMNNECRQDKIELMMKSNIQKCTLWCLKYNIPYYTF